MTGQNTVARWHTSERDEVFHALEVSESGLAESDVKRRLEKYGRNRMPAPPSPGLFKIIARQFRNPLVYGLSVVAFISFSTGHTSDAVFILAVLALNASIGAFQEWHAERSAVSLKSVAVRRTRVRRGNQILEIDAEELVPGDIVVLETGMQVPADIRLFRMKDLEVNESLLTGEAASVRKNHGEALAPDTILAERKNMLFAGTSIVRGRAEGVVVETASKTELGAIASDVLKPQQAGTPLLLRMEKFTRTLGYVMVSVIVLIGGLLLLKGEGFREVLFLTVALAVAAIPEGLPVALTVALSVGSRRMAGRKVIVKNLAAVEALGSCTFITSDKTGTLTVNALTAKLVWFPSGKTIEVPGEGLTSEKLPEAETQADDVQDLLRSVALNNEAVLNSRTDNSDTWRGHGDSVDLALLVFAAKGGVLREDLLTDLHLEKEIPFESEAQFAAYQYSSSGGSVVCVKGAVEKVLPMCTSARVQGGTKPLDADALRKKADELASAGYRLIAVASGTGPHLTSELSFLGLVGLIDPLRPESQMAVKESLRAGVHVAMITGDHPLTAASIARELDLIHSNDEVVTGRDLKALQESDAAAFHQRVKNSRVFARLEPRQKVQVVESLMQSGHFVGFVGDGANDGPAIRAANVGIAMGKSGTDVAREAADLILADDRFSSIVAGVREGRITYANVRKVIYLLLATSAVEIVLFFLAVLFGMPIPLTPIQLLWLNLVTDGIQVIALAFEPGEGDEATDPPKNPLEGLLDRLMIERVTLTAVSMGVVTFLTFRYLIQAGESLDVVRNHLLFLLVLFENVMIGNARSERKSAFAISPFRNPILAVSTLSVLALHTFAMYFEPLGRIIGAQSVDWRAWIIFPLLASVGLIVIEIQKWVRSGWFPNA